MENDALKDRKGKEKRGVKTGLLKRNKIDDWPREKEREEIK